MSSPNPSPSASTADVSLLSSSVLVGITGVGGVATGLGVIGAAYCGAVTIGISFSGGTAFTCGVGLGVAP